MAQRFEDITTVGRRFRALGLRKKPLRELAWLAASPEGAKLILQYLRTLHRLDVLEIQQHAERTARRRLTKKKK